MILRRCAALSLAAVLAGALVVTTQAAPSSAADDRPIRPGVQMVTEGAQCTANFVFERVVRKRVAVPQRHAKRDREGKHRRTKVRTVRTVYVGMAAHCAGKGSADDTDGCTTPSYPVGTPVDFVTGGNLLTAGTTVGRGRLAYSSWRSMQRAGTRDAATCAYNDFALVEVPRRYWSRVDPTVPGIGGPVGLAPLPPVGSTIHAVGSSSVRGTSEAKSGRVTARSAWTMTVRTGSPGVPGDSGSGYLDDRGRAVGVLSTLDVLPDVGANGVGSLTHEIDFARRHGLRGLRLVAGKRFTASSGSGSSGAGTYGLL